MKKIISPTSKSERRSLLVMLGVPAAFIAGNIIYGALVRRDQISLCQDYFQQRSMSSGEARDRCDPRREGKNQEGA